jgi:hypothetical protein
MLKLLVCVNKQHVSEVYVGVKVQIQIFVTLALDGGEWRVSCADCFMPGRQPLVPINPLPLNVLYICRTALQISRCCILNIYSTKIRTEYFKHAA